jgi:hypothetical protein
VDAVNELGLLTDAPFARFDPDPVTIANAQCPSGFAVDLDQRIRVEFTQLGNLVVLGVKKVGRPAGG